MDLHQYKRGDRVSVVCYDANGVVLYCGAGTVLQYTGLCRHNIGATDLHQCAGVPYLMVECDDGEIYGFFNKGEVSPKN